MNHKAKEGTAAWLRRLVPAPLRRRVGAAVRSRELRRGLRVARRGAELTDALLNRLSWAWDNTGFSGDVAYLRYVVESIRDVQGPVLECGSGLSTLLLAAYAAGRVPVVSLEHFDEWRDRVRGRAARCGLKVEVLHAGLDSYGDFDWYRLPEGMPDGIRLVICDGPPGNTRGGRYGLLPVCASRLAPGCIILLDDAERDDERHVAERWQREYGLSLEWRESESGVCAELRVPDVGFHVAPEVTATAGRRTA